MALGLNLARRRPSGAEPTTPAPWPPAGGIAFIDHSKHVYADGRLIALSAVEYALVKLLVDLTASPLPTWFLMAALFFSGAQCTQEKVDKVLARARDELRTTRIVIERAGPDGWRALVLKP